MMEKEVLKKHLEELVEGKKLVQELNARRNEQILICVTTVLVLSIGFHKDFLFPNILYKWLYRLDLLLLMLSLFVQVILLNEPARTVASAYQQYNLKLIKKLKDPSVSATSAVKQNRSERIATKIALPLFFVSMLGIVILGLLLSFK